MARKTGHPFIKAIHFEPVVTAPPLSTSDPTYRCTICGENHVDAENGFDTCEVCLAKR